MKTITFYKIFCYWLGDLYVKLVKSPEFFVKWLWSLPYSKWRNKLSMVNRATFSREDSASGESPHGGTSTERRILVYLNSVKYICRLLSPFTFYNSYSCARFELLANFLVLQILFTIVFVRSMSLAYLGCVHVNNHASLIMHQD